MKNQQQAIADAKNERDELCEQCFTLLHQISRRPGCLKLLALARNHLKMLAEYKAGRSQR